VFARSIDPNSTSRIGASWTTSSVVYNSQSIYQNKTDGDIIIISCIVAAKKFFHDKAFLEGRK
jgi:hypothetical protein